ncbi:MAG: hypothetical protein CUN55_21035, partial [Phototrophicales bacterium]
MVKLARVYAYQASVRGYLRARGVDHSLNFCKLMPLPHAFLVDLVVSSGADPSISSGSVLLQTCDSSMACPYCAFRASYRAYYDLLHVLDNLSDDYV